MNFGPESASDSGAKIAKTWSDVQSNLQEFFAR
jgi:hypothetical protein